MVNGSAVTGGWDEHSDLDVEAWCSGDAATTYAAVLALVRDELDVDHVWELPEATWPDRAAVLHPPAARRRRPVADRPGWSTWSSRPRPSGSPWTPAATARRSCCTTPTASSCLEHDDEARDAGAAGAGRRSRRPRGARPRPGWWSGRSPAATSPRRRPLHLRFAVEPLVRLLRIQHCPARLDFGLRYLRTDLPAGDGRAGGSTAARAGPGGPVPGSVRVAGRGPGSAHVTCTAVTSRSEA